MFDLQNKKAKSNMDIIFILLYWYPYEGALQPIYGKIIKHLTEKGHRVTIISSFPHFRQGRKEKWNEYRGKLFERTSWNGAQLIRSYVFAPIFKNEKNGLIYRGLNYISFNISSVLSGIFLAGNADIVFAPSSPPLTNGLCGWLISRIKRCPIVYNVQDMYPDMAEKTKILKSRLLLSFLRYIERAVYKVSDRILLLSEEMRRNVKNKGILHNRTYVIPNFFDTDFMKPQPRPTNFTKNWRLDKKFVVIYAGNIGIPHGAEVIIDAAEILQHEKNIIFCIVGRGEYKKRLETIVKQRDIVNVLFKPLQPFEKMPDIWSTASLSLITYKRGLAGDSLPTKLIAGMCCEIPVIGSVDIDSDTSKLIKKSNSGIVVNPEDATALSEAIKFLHDNPNLIDLFGKNGRKFILSNYHHRTISKKYEDFFRCLCR